MKNLQTKYQNAIKFAAKKHADINQLIPGNNLPYVVHLSNVAMEIMTAAHHTENFDAEFAVQVALLHDILEDTSTTFEELSNEFGIEIAKAVAALSKNSEISKENRMMDSISRIKELPKEVWSVKMADRITNLQAPPKTWSSEKIVKYHTQAKIISHSLQGGNQYLENRLEQKIIEYQKYCII